MSLKCNDARHMHNLQVARSRKLQIAFACVRKVPGILYLHGCIKTSAAQLARNEN
jgi:hypothetical protein